VRTFHGRPQSLICGPTTEEDFALTTPWPKLLALSALGCASPPERFEYSRPAMGTEFRIVLHASSRERADAAADAAFERLAELEACFSDYDPQSELGRLSRASDAGPTGAVAVSADLARVLARASELAAATGGAFDATVGPYVRLWRRAFRRAERPDAARLAAARAAVGHAALRVDPSARTVELAARGMRLDLGAIGKGYALDALLDVLAARGVARALVDGGGDVGAAAPPPGRVAWTVALDPLGSRAAATGVALANAAVATSGDAFRFVEIDGTRYSHLVDPRTGEALTRRIAASVVAPDGATADALASALCVLGPEAGLACIRALPGTEARISVLENGAWKTCESGGWARIMTRSRALRSGSPAAPRTEGTDR